MDEKVLGIIKNAVTLVNQGAGIVEALEGRVSSEPKPDAEAARKEAAVAVDEMIKAGLANPDQKDDWVEKLAGNPLAVLDTLAKASTHVQPTPMGGAEKTAEKEVDIPKSDQAMASFAGLDSSKLGATRSLR